MSALYASVCSLILFMACGSKSQPSSSWPSELPDNTAVKMQCFAWNAEGGPALSVDYDDQADVRLCSLVQKDGASGLDIRYQPQDGVIRPTLVSVTIRNHAGRSASESFPLALDEATGALTIALSQGCLVGSFGGCARHAPAAMRELMAPLGRQDDSSRTQPFTIDLIFTPLTAVAGDQAPRKDGSHFSLAIPAL